MIFPFWLINSSPAIRTASLDSAPPGTKFETIVARQRRVLALTELRVSFTVECSGLQDAERGATDVDYGDLDRATHDAALIENRAVFHGWPEAGITGIVDSSSHPWLTLGQDATTYPHASPTRPTCFARPASRVRIPWPSARRDTPASPRRPNTAAIRCASI